MISKYRPCGLHRLLSLLLFFIATISHLTAAPIEGRLPNGLRYVIVPNALPRHEVEMRLVMGVGSLQEDSTQLGGAHFLEHMAFAGTRHFPGNKWVHHFERQGMKYGRDINAFTGFDRTVYWLTLPAEAVTDSTFLAVRDIIDGICFDSVRLNHERGVIQEELRGYTTGDAFYSLKIGHGRYPERMPLGTAQSIGHVERSRLLAFYRQWYAPRYATLIVVGNVNADHVEQLINKRFASLENKQRATLTRYPLAYNKGVTLQTVTDSDATAQRLELIIPHPTTVVSHVKAHVQKERERLAMRLLSERLRTHGVRADVSNQWYLAATDHFVLSAAAPTTDSVCRTLGRALGEMENLCRYGVSEAELTRAVTDRLPHLVPDTAARLSSAIVDDLVDYALQGDRYRLSPNEAAEVRHAFANTTPKHISTIIKGILQHGRRTLLAAYTTNGENKQLLTTDSIAHLYREALAHPTAPYVFEPKAEHTAQHEAEEAVAVPAVLADAHPFVQPVSTTRYDELGVTAYRLPNSLELWVRPTLDADSTLYLSLLGRGGTADLPEENYTRYKDAASYVDMGSLKAVPADTLAPLMFAHNLSMSIGIDRHWHQVLASAPAAHAQELFNLVLQKVTAPGTDREGFNESRQEELNHFGELTPLEKLLQHDADRQLSRVADSLLENIPAVAFRPVSREDIERLNIDSLTRYYVRLFGSPRGKVLLLTGNLSANEGAVQCAINTFALLSDSTAAPAVADRAFTPSAVPFSRTFPNSVDSQAVLNIIYPTRYEPSLKASLTLKLMRDLLQQRLLSVLREDMNIVYSPYADLYYEGRPQQKAYLWLTVAVLESNRERALTAIDGIVRELQAKPVSNDELQVLKQSFLVTKRKMLSDVAPTEWRTALTGLVKNGETLTQFNAYNDTLATITPQHVMEAFRMYVKPAQRIVLTKQ